MSLRAFGRRTPVLPAAGTPSQPVLSRQTRPRHPRRASRITIAAVAAVGAIASFGLTATTASAATTADWEKLAQCESGGNWSINTGNGYYGGVQFSSSTWLGYGGGAYAATANLASEPQQIVIANKVLAGQGWGAWPVCSRKEGLTGEPTTGGPTSGGGSGSGHAKAHRSHKKAAAMKLPRTHPVLSKRMYTVRRGDTLASIAARAHVRAGWKLVWAANSATLKNPDRLYVGERLHMPRTRHGMYAH